MWHVTHPEDLALARRAADADPTAWDEVVERYGDRIFGLACRFAGRETDAEDLTQEVFLKLYRNLHQYRGDVPLVAWALRLSRNLCIDHYRAARARRVNDHVSEEALERLPSADNPQVRSQMREQMRMVHDALGELSEPLATVVMLRDLQDLSYDEIATFLEVPAGTVKSRLNRARRALVAAIERRLAASAPNPLVEQGAC